MGEPKDPVGRGLFYEAAGQPRPVGTQVRNPELAAVLRRIARRAVGPGRGYGVTGALAGLISSTALTVQFSRLSRLEPQHARGLGLGVMAAAMVVPVRVMLISAALSPLVARELLVYMAAPLVVAVLASALLLRNSASVEAPAPDPRCRRSRPGCRPGRSSSAC